MWRGAISNWSVLVEIEIICARHQVEFSVELPLAEEAWKL
jgi:hypothetical protein